MEKMCGKKVHDLAQTDYGLFAVLCEILPPLEQERWFAMTEEPGTWGICRACGSHISFPVKEATK